MPQRDLVAELRTARVEAPSEVRERVLLIAAAAPSPPQRLTWRRAFAVGVPVAAAVAAAVVLAWPQPHGQRAVVLNTPSHTALHAQTSPATRSAATPELTVPQPKSRAQLFGATLSLEVRDSRHLSDAVKRAVAVAGSLGGFASSVHAETHGRHGTADLTLKVPRAHVQEALARLSQLGTIRSENVSTVDRQALLNATGREIARLQKQLTALRAEPQSAANDRRIAALVRRIEQLQRGTAAIRRAAHYATIKLHVETALAILVEHHGHGPLHGVVVALTWLGIAAVYALAVGIPVAVVLGLLWLLVRAVRRRRENALLSRS